jgi:hypothetical protein
MTKQKCRSASAFSPARVHRLMWLAAGRPRVISCNPGKDPAHPGHPAAFDAPGRFRNRPLEATDE